MEGRHGRSAPLPRRVPAVDSCCCCVIIIASDGATTEAEFRGLGCAAVRGLGRGSDGGSDGSGASASAVVTAKGANEGAERRSRDSAAFVRDVLRRGVAGTGDVERGGTGGSSLASGCGGAGRARGVRGGSSAPPCVTNSGGGTAGRTAEPGSCVSRFTPCDASAGGGSGGAAAWSAVRVVSSALRSFSAASFTCRDGVRQPAAVDNPRAVCAPPPACQCVGARDAPASQRRSPLTMRRPLARLAARPSWARPGGRQASRPGAALCLPLRHQAPPARVGQRAA